jgi:DNA-binding MarR family transcriptional regulator
MTDDRSKIFSLMFAIGRRMRHEKEKYSMLHIHTLRYVSEQGKPFMHDVAAYLCVTPSAATLLVDGLVNDRLLIRSFGKRDRRAVQVALTERGRKFLERGVRDRMRTLKTMFAALTVKEQKQLIVILEKILSLA